MQWSTSEDYLKLPNKKVEYMGFVYAVEYGDQLKIGCTTKLKERIVTLKSQAEKYANKRIGKVAYTPLHTNYCENEKLLHHHFQNYRHGKSELFNMTFGEFIKKKPELTFLTDTSKLEEESAQFSEAMKRFTLNGRTSINSTNFQLKKEDYFKAAELVATCEEENLPVVVHLLSQAGFDVQEVSDTPCDLDFALVELLNLSLRQLVTILKLPKTSLSYYRTGKYKPSPERRQYIIETLQGM